MRLMLPSRFAVGIGLAAILSSTAAAPRMERFLGSGRACYGALTLTPETIAWLTTFSRCEPTRFRIIDQTNVRTTFRMAELSSECRYQVVSLAHGRPDDPDKGWHVTGYHDEASFREHQAAGFTTRQDKTLSCYLIRDPDPAGQLDW
jgi:hypothetical protein